MGWQNKRTDFRYFHTGCLKDGNREGRVLRSSCSTDVMDTTIIKRPRQTPDERHVTKSVLEFVMITLLFPEVPLCKYVLKFSGCLSKIISNFVTCTPMRECTVCTFGAYMA